MSAARMTFETWRTDPVVGLVRVWLRVLVVRKRQKEAR